MLDSNCCVYYDPLKPRLTLVYGEQSMRKFICYLLLKCSYADNSHVQENKGHYMGPDAPPIRRTIYKLWQNINTQELGNLYDVRTKPVGPNPNSNPNPSSSPDPDPNPHPNPNQVGLDLDRYYLVNSARDATSMSTQQTGNTCYFQTYLFAILCKVGRLSLGRDGHTVAVADVDGLQVGLG